MTTIGKPFGYPYAGQVISNSVGGQNGGLGLQGCTNVEYVSPPVYAGFPAWWRVRMAKFWRGNEACDQYDEQANEMRDKAKQVAACMVDVLGSFWQNYPSDGGLIPSADAARAALEQDLANHPVLAQMWTWGPEQGMNLRLLSDARYIAAGFGIRTCVLGQQVYIMLEVLAKTMQALFRLTYDTARAPLQSDLQWVLARNRILTGNGSTYAQRIPGWMWTTGFQH